METYSTFQYYDQKSRRLAVFCRFLNSIEAEIFTLTCSKEDQFNKKYAHKVYKDYIDGKDPLFEKHKPIIELVENNRFVIYLNQNNVKCK